MIVQLSRLAARLRNKQRAQRYLSAAQPLQGGHDALYSVNDRASRGRLVGTLGLLVILPLTTIPLYAGVYKWTDASGQVHYTDQYQEGSEAVDLPEPTVYKPVPLPDASETPAVGAEPTSTGDYDLMEVSAPAEGETVRSNEGQVTVSLRLEPTLRQDDVIELFLDGKKVPGELRTTSATLSNLNRGTHSFKARVVNASGQVLISSEAVSFHLRRQSKLFRQRNEPTPLPAGQP